MIEIDGSQKSGSGTILRLSIALSSITKEPLHIFNIRQRRNKKGLRPQHLESVNTAAKLCNAEIKGATIGSNELWFRPHNIINGEIRAEIGTAGSIPMLILTILPICSQAKGDVKITVVNGGTDVPYSPTINYLKHILLPILQRMGLNASLAIKRYGYYPKGMGKVVLNVKQCSGLSAVQIDEFGKIKEISGISICTFLEKQRVAERQARTAHEILQNHGYDPKIEIINDKSNPYQKGSSLVLIAKTDKGALLGADSIGELRKTSETVGRQAAEKLLHETETKSTVDVHLADILIPYIALANGDSTYYTRTITEHLETNIWLVEKILDMKIQTKKVGNLFEIRKIK
ncbi:MAG: RNA 3'-terminal phosphate cyclase [Candidatus Bathyarchaeota archaeon]